MLLGAGGRWAVIDEVADTRVVGQRSNLSCDPASAQMLISCCAFRLGGYTDRRFKCDPNRVGAGSAYAPTRFI